MNLRSDRAGPSAAHRPARERVGCPPWLRRGTGGAATPQKRTRWSAGGRVSCPRPCSRPNGQRGGGIEPGVQRRVAREGPAARRFLFPPVGGERKRGVGRCARDPGPDGPGLGSLRPLWVLRFAGERRSCSPLAFMNLNGLEVEAPPGCIARNDSGGGHGGHGQTPDCRLHASACSASSRLGCRGRRIGPLDYLPLGGLNSGGIFFSHLGQRRRRGCPPW